MAYRDVYSTYLIVIRERRWDVPVEMGLGEEALCKNVQKLRPPPRQRGVGRRMAPQSGDLNPTVSIGELSSCHAALKIMLRPSPTSLKRNAEILRASETSGVASEASECVHQKSHASEAPRRRLSAHAPPRPAPRPSYQHSQTYMCMHGDDVASTRARRASAPRPWRPWRPCPPT